MRCKNENEDVYKEEGERIRLVSLWVDELLKCPDHTVRKYYTPVADFTWPHGSTPCSVL